MLDEDRRFKYEESLRLRKSLREFAIAVWPILEPDRELSWNWHHDVICDVLQRITGTGRGQAAKGARVIINVPPGTMKSLLVSVIWPAWEWAKRPGLRYLAASYGSHLSIRDNLRLRSIVDSDWYKDLFPRLRLSGDQNSKVRFDTTKKGWRIATSVDGMGTGEHPDRIIIDDPISAQQARSQAERNAVNHWMDRTISSRGKVRNASIVVIMQRLHEEDLTGHLLAKGGWEHVCLPMHFRREGADPRDYRREEGELLWPEVFTPEKVRDLEIDLGPYGAASQLEQSPSPEGGGLFRREWFKVVDVAPVKARRMRGWDTGGTELSGDYTAGVKIAATDDGRYFVEHVARAQLGPGGVDELIYETAQADGKLVGVREEKEGGSAGKAVIAARTKRLAGYDYRGVAINKDKVTRAKAFRTQCEAGNVFMVRGTWNEAYLDELEVFPMGKHDDQVDGSSAAFNALVEERPRVSKLKFVS